MPPLQVKLYNERRSDLEEQQLHLNVNLEKIRETVDQVEELQASLSIKKNDLEQILAKMPSPSPTRS